MWSLKLSVYITCPADEIDGFLINDRGFSN